MVNHPNRSAPLRAQRDELLAALKELEAAFKRAELELVATLKRAELELAAAIAKAESKS